MQTDLSKIWPPMHLETKMQKEQHGPSVYNGRDHITQRWNSKVKSRVHYQIVFTENTNWLVKDMAFVAMGAGHKWTSIHSALWEV